MKVLLDTHAFIWWDSEPEKLSLRARVACEDQSNELFLSVASVWLAETIADQQRTNGLQLLSISLDHVLALQELPAHHNDPFDRLLIAQANFEQPALISHASVFAQYSVEVLW